MNNALFSTLNKIEKIIDALGINEEKQKMTENLIASIYIEMVNQTAVNPQNKDILLELSKKDPKTQEEFTGVYNYITEKSKELGYDASVEIEKASKIVLENFIQELQPDLSPEKIVELNKIIAG